MAAITALTAQNTQGVMGVHVPPVSFLTSQLDAVAADIAIDAVKIGMLGTAEVMKAVGEWLVRVPPPWWFLTLSWLPPAVTRSWAGAREALLALLKLTHLVTPNLAGAGGSAGPPGSHHLGRSAGARARTCRRPRRMVLVKGGHLPGIDVP